MNYKQALRVAVKSMQKDMRAYAFDANLNKYYGADYPRARTAVKYYRKLISAIEILQGQLEATDDIL